MAKEIFRADSLTKLIQSYSLKTVVEVGVAGGRLSRELLTRNPHIDLTLVDFWPPEYQLFDDPEGEKVGIERALTRKRSILELMGTYPSRAKLIEMPSIRAAKCFDDASLDLVFIDADHLYDGCKADILAWTPKVRYNGWLTGHDYSDRFPGVVQAADEMAKFFLVTLDKMPGDVWAWRV